MKFGMNHAPVQDKSFHPLSNTLSLCYDCLWETRTIYPMTLLCKDYTRHGIALVNDILHETPPRCSLDCSAYFDLQPSATFYAIASPTMLLQWEGITLILTSEIWPILEPDVFQMIQGFIQLRPEIPQFLLIHRDVLHTGLNHLKQMG